ncbi:hypothetical protein MMC06_001533 [Schaereria dolodes]|nr:hypothetical protein [Schaereria dolodes]
MVDLNFGTPRVYLARHGETEWSKTGQFTSITDLPLTEYGARQVLGTASLLVGPSKLISSSRLIHVFVSPRKRAQQTLDLLFGKDGTKVLVDGGKVTTTEELREWQYGAYEGLKTEEIRELRRRNGLDRDRAWDIWRDGTEVSEGGESAEKVTERLDRLITKIQEFQEPNIKGAKPADVLLVAHGHILRAFAKRWLNYPMDFPLSMMLETGGVGTLSYQHQRIDEPAFLLGMSFPLPADDA